MACTIATGKARYCKVQPGGIDRVYVINRFDTNHVTGVAFTAGVATASSGVSAAGAGTWFEFNCDPYLSGLTQTVVVNEGGGVGYQQDLELVFKGAFGETDVTMQNLANGTWQIAVLDNAGSVYLCGLDKGMIATGGSFIHNGDKALSDNLAYTLTFSATELLPAANCGTDATFIAQTKVTISAAQITG